MLTEDNIWFMFCLGIPIFGLVICCIGMINAYRYERKSNK